MIFAILALVAAGQSFSCRIVAVHDGDTMRCADGTRVRLQGIDANELDGSCHKACARLPADMAQSSLRDLALHKIVACRSTGRSYDRVTAWCAVKGLEGRTIDLSCEQVMRGAAIIWRKFDPGRHLDQCAATRLPDITKP